jgi:hypothetical protein
MCEQKSRGTAMAVEAIGGVQFNQVWQGDKNHLQPMPLSDEQQPLLLCRNAQQPVLALEGLPLRIDSQHGLDLGETPLLRVSDGQILMQAPGGLSIQTGNPLAPALTVSADGKMGIGTAAPAAKLEVSGELKVGIPEVSGVHLESSALYFTKPDHSHIGFANFEQHPGYAAIENAANFDALMILGRSTAQGRRVRLWDFLEVNGDLHVTGAIRSPRWTLIGLMNDSHGPLPMDSRSFNTQGGVLLVFASGSGFRRQTDGQIGMEILLDGTLRGRARGFTNEPNSHKAFTVQALVVSGVSAGQHTITLRSWNETSTDLNDFFTVTVLELPCAHDLGVIILHPAQPIGPI